MRHSILIAVFGALSAVGASPASAYLASNGLVVEQQAKGFFVPYRGESGAPAFWCAAGEFAETQLRVSPTQTLYRTSEPPRRSGQGIGFSLNARDAAGKTGLAVFGAVGGGITIGHARSLCDAVLFNFD